MLPHPWVHFFIAIRVGSLLSEGAWVEPFLLRMDSFSLVRIAHHVDTLLVAASYVFRVAAGGDRVGLPRSDLHDAIERPPSSQTGYQPGSRLVVGRLRRERH